MRKNLSYNDVPAVLSDMQTDLKEVKSMLKEVLSGAAAAKEDRLVFGLFKRNEIVAMCDKRLWNEPSSPFKDYKDVYRAKENGCKFKRPAGEHRYYIKASVLEDWFCEWNGHTEIPEL